MKKQTVNGTDVYTIELSSEQYNIPFFSQNKNKNPWVNYGDDNQMPEFLLNLSTESALHPAILDKKVLLDMGNDIIPVTPDEKTSNFIKNINQYQNLYQLNERVMRDLEVFGGSFLEVTWTKGASNIKRTIASVSHMPYQRFRSGWMDENNIVNEYYYAEKWKRYMAYSDYTIKPAFNKDNITDIPQILYLKKYNVQSFYYPNPVYFGAINDINTLAETSIFNNSNIKNSLNPGVYIIFKEVPKNKEEKDKIIEGLVRRHKGAKKAGNATVFFADGTNNVPEIKQIEANKMHELFKELRNTSTSNVLISHSMPRVVAGEETQGALGSQKEVLEQMELFKQQYTSKQQNFVLQYYNMLMEINGLQPLQFVNEKPSLRMYSEQFLQATMTREELRTMMGLTNNQQ